MTAAFSLRGKATVTACARQSSTARNYATRPIQKKNEKNGEHHRELLMDILSANATKRDAKQYLSRFKVGPSESFERTEPGKQDKQTCSGVNLGELFAPARAIAEHPQFTRHKDGTQHSPEGTEHIHVALVCLTDPHALDNVTLDGIALTLAQLVKLDMRIVIILGVEDPNLSDLCSKTKILTEEAQRLSDAISMHSPIGSRAVPGCLEIDDDDNVVISPRSLVTEPVERGLVPIIPSLAYDVSGHSVAINAADGLFALAQALSATNDTISLDRIILLEKSGGIPSTSREDGSHIFINLKQEFDDIALELQQLSQNRGEASAQYLHHGRNLQAVQKCLSILPSATSALIISPHEAASASQRTDSHDTIRTGTRRQKNTLIHNLLTNRPNVSSSLPAGRRPRLETSDRQRPNAATLLKLGMPLTIVPQPSPGSGWAYSFEQSSLSLKDDPRINFPSLLHLIEDSFQKTLDVEHYLNRVSGRVAGVIIAGDYEGGAILTWEQPPGTVDPARRVPYLDKFAVLQSSQGSSGVADIVFQAMVRSCFPHGVCWRSRKNNPVNKWYFERATGSWQIPETGWTMFWTGDNIVQESQRFNDYLSVCRSVVPSLIARKSKK